MRYGRTKKKAYYSYYLQLDKKISVDTNIIYGVNCCTAFKLFINRAKFKNQKFLINFHCMLCPFFLKLIHNFTLILRNICEK